MTGRFFQIGFLVAGSMARAAGADQDAPQAPAPNPDAAQTSVEDLLQLRALLEAQQKQLDTLRRAVDKALDRRAALNSAAVAVTPAVARAATPVVTPVFPLPKAAQTAAAVADPCNALPDADFVPTYLRIGSTCIVPIGFMDLTGIWRDENSGSGIGSNYGSVPYNNVTAGKLSEFRFSPQNSRLGFRVDGDWKDFHYIAYNEIDFLGASGTNNLGVTNGAFVPRIRLFWLDVRKGHWELLGGQSWSLLTPNRRGLSALPNDLFYSAADDANYMAGLTWSRQPGIRVLYHPNAKVTAGISLENPDQYLGGSGGLSSTAVTLPAAAALSGLGGTQIDNATNVLNTPNLVPDIIAKIALDPSAKFHFEVGGVARTFRIWDSATSTRSTKEGAGFLVGGNVEIFKNVRAISTNFWSDGGGRYLFGEAPDFVVRANGSISTIHAGGTVDGLEATMGNWLLYAYYGGIYIGRDTALDANGLTRIGYGFAGSSANDNRAIQELTFGYNKTIWKDVRYGAVNMMGQYEWLSRDPWAVAPGSPKSAHDNAVFLGFRYLLPGAMPKF
jgi:hypothetical protein